MTPEALQRWQAILVLAKHCLLLGLVVVAAYTDLAKGKVYNWCTYSAILIGLGLAFMLDGLTPGHYRHTLNSVFGLALAGALFALPYFMGWLGGGDLKLAAAIGAASGAVMRGHFFVVYAMLYAALVGFVLGMGVLIWRGEAWSGLKRSMLVLFTLRRHKHALPDANTPEQEPPESLTLPYGFALATGTMLAWFVFLHRGWLLMPQR